MSDHNKSSSSDDSWQKLAIPYSEFDVLINDIDETELERIGDVYEVDHLGAGSFSSPAFPVGGRIYGLNIRYMIPLVCQRAGKPKSRAVNIWFLVITGSPFTCLTVKSLSTIFGPENAIDKDKYYELAIQDQNSKIVCQVSKAHFSEVNLLGVDTMRKLELSIVVDWTKDEFQLVKP